MKTWSINVKGIVQGVYFRASTLKKAQELDVKGWVRNEADGSVNIQAQGNKDKIEQLIKWLHQGPDRARVDEVDIDKKRDIPPFDDFRILR